MRSLPEHWGSGPALDGLPEERETQHERQSRELVLGKQPGGLLLWKYRILPRITHSHVSVYIIHRVIIPVACNHYTMYNAHLYFPLKNLGRKAYIIHGKIWLLEWVRPRRAGQLRRSEFRPQAAAGTGTTQRAQARVGSVQSVNREARR